jgi:hypothetical protein
MTAAINSAGQSAEAASSRAGMAVTGACQATKAEPSVVAASKIVFFCQVLSLRVRGSWAITARVKPLSLITGSVRRNCAEVDSTSVESVVMSARLPGIFAV